MARTPYGMTPHILNNKLILLHTQRFGTGDISILPAAGSSNRKTLQNRKKILTAQGAVDA